MDPRQRPLSPHLQVYQPQLTSVLSILHRAAGVHLALGLMALALWVIALGSSEYCFSFLMTCASPVLGKLVLGSWIVAFFYHFANGIRHLIWDAGAGFNLESVYWGGWIVLGFTVLASAFVLKSLI